MSAFDEVTKERDAQDFHSRGPAEVRLLHPRAADVRNRRMVLCGRLERARTFGGSPGLSVSRDGRWILYWQVDYNDNDIMLVENFR